MHSSALPTSTILSTLLLAEGAGGSLEPMHIGGALIARVPGSSLSTPLSTLLGTSYGLLFVCLRARRIASVESGLLPLLQGAASPGMLDEARAHFPKLVTYLLCFGFPLGIITGVLTTSTTSGERMDLTFLRAVTVGGLAGLVGGWALRRLLLGSRCKRSNSTPGRTRTNSSVHTGRSAKGYQSFGDDQSQRFWRRPRCCSADRCEFDGHRRD
jgi:hypothetical protein